MAVDLDGEVHDRVEDELATFRLSFPVDAFERFELAEHGVWEPVAAFPLAR
jgi:hypothetical protein